MKFREHRGGLSEAMETVVELDPTHGALKAHITHLLKDWGVPMPLDIEVKKYGTYDHRIGWDTHIVMVEGWGVIGFTDQMPEQIEQLGRHNVK